MNNAFFIYSADSFPKIAILFYFKLSAVTLSESKPDIIFVGVISDALKILMSTPLEKSSSNYFWVGFMSMLCMKSAW